MPDRRLFVMDASEILQTPTIDAIKALVLLGIDARVPRSIAAPLAEHIAENLARVLVDELRGRTDVNLHGARR